MAHEIDGENFIEATHGGRFVAWHGIGEQNPGEFLTFDDLMKDGINFETEFQELTAANGQSLSSFARSIVRKDTGAPLSVVGLRYEITQHKEFFSDVNDALDGKARFETAGVLRGGREVFALAQGDQFAVAGKDILNNYVYFRTSYDGTSPNKAKAVNTRVVCMNTTRIALTEKGTSFDHSFRHTKHSADRIKEILTSISKSNRAFEKFGETANKMAEADYKKADVSFIINLALEKAFGAVDNSGTKRTADSRTENYRAGAEYMAKSLALPENRDLGKWGLYNAVSDWTDHVLTYRQRESSRKSSDEKRFESIIDGRADAVKQAAFSSLSVAA